MQRARWSHHAGLELTAPAEKTSLCYSYLWMALRRTCGVQGLCSAAWTVVLRGRRWQENQLSCGVVAVQLLWGFSALPASDSFVLYLVPSISSPAPFSLVKTILFFLGLVLTFVVFVRRPNQEMLAGCSFRLKYPFLENYYYYF